MHDWYIIGACMGILALICLYCYTSRTINETHFFLPSQFYQIAPFRPHLKDIQNEALRCLYYAPLSPIVQKCNLNISPREFRKNTPHPDGWTLAQPDGHHIPDKRWIHYGLMFDGVLFAENAKRCPTLARILLHLRAHINTCGLSLLMPNSQIAAHADRNGRQNSSRSYHLGLIVPPKKCTLYVGNREMKEKNGREIVFDSNITHYAANLADSVRIILYANFSLAATHNTYSQSY